MEVSDEDWHYPTCNVFYLRAALESVGGFDERFRYACGEDTDLAWRVKKRGHASRFCAGAVIVHEVRPPDFVLFLKERRRFADQVLLVKRHPALRRFYYRRYFYRRSHLHVVAAIVVAGLALHSTAAMLLLPAIWVDRLRRSNLGRDWRSRARSAVQLLVADYWEFSVFCYANLRYRSILL
jgi:GT2 family glycosyltransferase